VKHDEEAATPSTTAPPRTTTPRRTTAPRRTADTPRPLSDLLIDTPPAGFVELTADAGPNGAFDLEKLLQHSENPERDRALFSQHSFKQGFARSWEKLTPEGPHRIVVSVFEFADVSKAVIFLIDKREQTLSDEGGERLAVESGMGVRYVHRVGDELVHSYDVAFHDGARVFYLGAFYPNAHPADEIRALEARQREQLDRGADAQ
jgi:hypothetical protein